VPGRFRVTVHGFNGSGFRVQRFSPAAGLKSGQFDQKIDFGFAESIKQRISKECILSIS
jgi:hypothetical protein